MTTNQMYPATISVHIPVSSLKDYRMDLKCMTKSIAHKTKTYIESYELTHLQTIRFCIFGKWRDCLQAGRLLWYQLSRVITIYVHFDWVEDFEKPMRDQKNKPFKQLYRNVKFKFLSEFNLFSISGICWDVLKVRKELLKRCTTKTINEQQMVGIKTEIMALQVLNCIRADINDGIYSPESIYSIRNSQLLHLITGSKSISTVDQIETIRYPKEFVGNSLTKDIKAHNLSKHLVKTNDKLPLFKEQPIDPKQIISKSKANSQIYEEMQASKACPTLKETQNQKNKHSVQWKSLRYSVTRSEPIETKCENSIEDKSNSVSNSQTKCQTTLKSNQVILQVNQMNKVLNPRSMAKTDTKSPQDIEHKLIADRIELLVLHSQRNQTCNKSQVDVESGCRESKP